MSPSPKAFSAAAEGGEPFDWPAFARTLQWQPASQWLILNALAYPFSNAFPALTRASCPEPARTMVAKTALVVYTMFVPAAAAAAAYLLVGRKKFARRRHRLLADATLAMIVALSAADTISIVAQARARWPILGPALSSLRGACWPGRP